MAATANSLAIKLHANFSDGDLMPRGAREGAPTFLPGSLAVVQFGLFTGRVELGRDPACRRTGRDFR